MTEDLLLWTDVETTGLKAEDHELLEVAAFITDRDLNILPGSMYHATIRHVPGVRDLANDYVKEMHDRTGLWQKVGDPDTAVSLGTVEDDLLTHIKKFAPTPRSIRIAGNSVRLDLNFIDEHLPAVSEHLHYRVLDVSSFAFLAYNTLGFEEFKKTTAHTAESDIEESYEEYKYILDCIGTIEW